MSLIYFCIGENSTYEFDNDFIKFSPKVLLIFFEANKKMEFQSFIRNFINKLELNESEVISYFKENTLELVDKLSKIKLDLLNNTFNNHLFLCIEMEIDKPILNSPSFESFKLFIEKLYDIDTIDAINIDYSNCPSLIAIQLQFYLLNVINTEKTEIIKPFFWRKYDKNIQNIPINFIDGTSTAILNIISNGHNTIKEIQSVYPVYRNTNKPVSQPFVSKYISNLENLKLVKEDWVEGIKLFTITNEAYYYLDSKIRTTEKLGFDITEKSFIKFSNLNTSELILKLKIYSDSKDETILSQIINELKLRDNIESNELKRVINSLENYESEAIFKFLQYIVAKHPNEDVYLSYFAIMCYKRGEKEKALQLLKKTIKLNPENKLAWKILGNIVK